MEKHPQEEKCVFDYENKETVEKVSFTEEILSQKAVKYTADLSTDIFLKKLSECSSSFESFQRILKESQFRSYFFETPTMTEEKLR